MSIQTSTSPPTSRDVREYISPSRLNLWLKCPLAFRLRYIDGMEQPTTSAQLVGTVTHAGLEFYYRHRQMGVTVAEEEIAGYLVESWNRAAEESQITFADKTQAESLQRQIGSLVAAYLDHLPADEPPPLAVETRLTVPLIDPESGADLGMPLLGIVDLILDDPDGPLVCDFKTAARGGVPLEIMNEIQLSSYAWLLRQSHGQIESAIEIRQLIKTKTPRVEFHRYEARQEKHFSRLFAILRAYLDDLDRGEFIPRPGFGCSMCPFAAGECLAWSGR